ncbi:TadE/TadG family type IV pilus assembly protein [Noviherbaspirillum pedocola]|uniref:Pilus assembly protein n=1 Tax=Noviherbaspirillum pedocola TaxID=2801341 RepID=A0A934SR98_9BURK|nr:TadE family protein [Noviherbaspirillum pedocola]MBK4733818.1 pilus assembly protein [Noviherbaspirillum pedocola]
MTRPFPQSKKILGAASVEFALIALFIFLPLLFGMIEMGRVMYLWNTAQEITRRAARAAVVTDFTNAAAMTTIRQNAIFRSDSGSLPAGMEITDSSVVINYLSLSQQVIDPTTTCPAKNISNCIQDPTSSSCIRFVEVSLCQPGTGQTNACSPIIYSPLGTFFSILKKLNISLPIPASSVVMPAESLGYRPNATPC